MRPLITALLIIALLGGIFAYTQFAESVKPEPPDFMKQQAKGEFTVRVTRTFDCVADPDFDIAALRILFNKQVVYSRTEILPAAESITTPPLVGVQPGNNDIVVEARAKSKFDFSNFDNNQDMELSFDSLEETPRGMRVEVLLDGNTIAEDSIWNSSGLELFSGSVEFTVKKTTLIETGDH